MATILLVVFFLILMMLIIVSYKMHNLSRENEDSDITKETKNRIHGWVYAAIVFIVIAMMASLYFVLKGSIYEPHMREWLNIIVRVMHITFGIAWIGASFYFVFLENSLNRTENVRDELAGNLWAVHGGGFYYLEKYKVAPRTIPKTLHWFKYEAYFTWLSGVVLLFIVYYFNASAMLVDESVLQLSSVSAIAIGLSSLLAGWFIYDVICKSPVRKNGYVFAFTIFLFLALFAWGYSQLFSARAAYIHFGALIGTLMAGNVFFVIIPSQKAMVAAAKKGIMPEAGKGKNALFRSIHNNYFTLPVLFIMVSNHFPGTFGNENQWLILLGITLATVGIKHWLNLRERRQVSVWVLPVSIVLLLAIAILSAPVPLTTSCKPVDMTDVNRIVQTRCISCHSSKPTDEVYTVAPNGVVYDTPKDIENKKDLILQRVVLTETMPLNNKTNMTPGERDLIRCWILGSQKNDHSQ